MTDSDDAHAIAKYIADEILREIDKKHTLTAGRCGVVHASEQSKLMHCALTYALAEIAARADLFGDAETKLIDQIMGDEWAAAARGLAHCYRRKLLVRLPYASEVN